MIQGRALCLPSARFSHDSSVSSNPTLLKSVIRNWEALAIIYQDTHDSDVFDSTSYVLVENAENCLSKFWVGRPTRDRRALTSFLSEDDISRG